MGDWGKGMLQSQREYRILCDYEDLFGLRELRAKVNAKAGFTADDTGMQAIRLAVGAEYCYGSQAVEISRKYLDTGVLSAELLSYVDGENYRDPTMTLTFVTLTAGAMTLGCTLAPKVKDILKKFVKTKDPKAFLTPMARSQMDKALSTYVDGTPYSFGNKSMYESMFGDRMPGSKTTMTNVGNQKVVQTVLPSGMTIPQLIGPPTDEEIGLQPIHPYDVCAACGSERAKATDAKLLVCGKCKERKYCSVACQKKHWKLHKPICSRDKETMEAFMNSIPLDWKDEAEPNFAELLGDSPVMMGMGQGAKSGMQSR